jgi:hypothetical protein
MDGKWLGPTINEVDVLLIRNRIPTLALWWVSVPKAKLQI